MPCAICEAKFKKGDELVAVYGQNRKVYFNHADCALRIVAHGVAKTDEPDDYKAMDVEFAWINGHAF